MRMYLIDKRILCRQHLLGAHNELHKFRPDFVKKKKMTTRIYKNQIHPLSMKDEHDGLAAEMKRRGYKHNSPYILPDLSYLSFEELLHPFSPEKALEYILNKCPECLRRYEELYGKIEPKTL